MTNWIICAGMIRSGSTLQYQLATALVEWTGCGQGYGFIQPDEFEGLDAPEGFGVVKVHTLYDELKPLLDTAAVLYCYRDLRDVLVSFMHFKGVSYREALDANILRHALDTYNQWTACKRIHIVRYENFINGTLANEVEQMAQFMGIACHPNMATAIAETYTLERNRARQGQDMLHNNHILDGAREQWRDKLTPTQAAFVEGLVFNWLHDRGYTLTHGETE